MCTVHGWVQAVEMVPVQVTAGAVADERMRWVRLILQADELQDPAGALATLVNMARVEHDSPGAT